MIHIKDCFKTVDFLVLGRKLIHFYFHPSPYLNSNLKETRIYFPVSKQLKIITAKNSRICSLK